MTSNKERTPARGVAKAPKRKEPAGKKKAAPAARPVRTTPSKAPTPEVKPRASATAIPVLLLSGEGSLALEYAVAAAAKGYAVHLWNVDPLPAKSALPQQASIVATPTANAAVALEVTISDRAAKQRNVKALDSALPTTSPIISSSLTVTAVEQASWIVGKHRLVGCAALPTYASKLTVEVAPTVFSPRQTLEAVGAFYASLGQRMELVQDRVGLVSARIICQLINEAAFALQEDVARPEDVDTAMQLGVNYPHGPFAWADILGMRNVVAILQALHADYAEERYRVSPLLRQMALGGEWWRRQLEQSPKGM
ncbi:MAG: 3-hydroxyacyl-CoA dehydrogenase family protein [Bacteroidetes bacterium]|jgi:3-hydroxybutyryl-CoA dehydrogenase|nr:3-hydroxyacyl-CoA dehydrogenase family protein [Bacteroidota bacterium]